MLLLKAGQSGQSEALAPLAYDLPWRIEARSDEVIRNPSAAMRMILARTTSQYGDVYRRAMRSNSRRSSAERCTIYGVCLGINARNFAETSLSDWVTKWGK